MKLYNPVMTPEEAARWKAKDDIRRYLPRVVEGVVILGEAIANSFAILKQAIIDGMKRIEEFLNSVRRDNTPRDPRLRKDRRTW